MIKLPGGEGGGLLDGEAGPGEGFAGGQVLDFDGGAHGADELNRVAVLLPPRDLRRPRIRHLVAVVVVVVVVIGIDRAFQPSVGPRR
jgi:hypothetical protein